MFVKCVVWAGLRVAFVLLMMDANGEGRDSLYGDVWYTENHDRLVWPLCDVDGVYFKTYIGLHELSFSNCTAPNISKIEQRC
jgi:hypothetical protein